METLTTPPSPARNGQTRESREPHRRNDPPQSQVSLEQAVRTMRAIRERYESGHNVGSDYVRAYSVQVAFGYADMFWITAAIEAIEKVIAAGAIETAGSAAQDPPTT